jgi:hypothetical protein
VRYYIKCKLNPKSREKLANSINSGNLAKGKIFYEGMQAALRTATIDETDTVHFIEVCYCLEGGLYPMAMEIPTLKEYFESVEEVRDGRFREKCTMECEACDCTRAIKLPGMPLVKKLKLRNDDMDRKEISRTEFIDYGRVELNRQKQRQGMDALKKVIDECLSSKIKPVMGGAAISGLFAIFYDDNGEYFRIKNIPDTKEARHILDKLGLDIHDSVESVKENARCSLAGSDRYSDIV